MDTKELEQAISALKAKAQERDRQYLRQEIRQLLGERGIPQGQLKRDLLELCLTDLTTADGDVTIPQDMETFVTEKLQTRPPAPVNAPASSPTAGPANFDLDDIKVGMRPEDERRAWEAMAQALKPKA